MISWKLNQYSSFQIGDPPHIIRAWHRLRLASYGKPAPLRFLSFFKKQLVLLRMRAIHVALCHLLHHEVAVDFNILREHVAFYPPFSGDFQGTNGRLSVDKRVDTVINVGEGELVGSLSDGLLVGNGVRGFAGRITSLELIGDQGRAEGFNHELVIVEGGDDLFL